jgi:serine-type D-Ala-D-Ala carboxypeptidase/endopeptidase (penicillin-binding protein 4)
MAVCRLCLAVFLLSFAGPECAAETLPPGFATVLEAPRYLPSHWGILVTDLESGKDIYEHNAYKLFGPASTTKLFTMAAGLDALGAGVCFETPVFRTGPVDGTGTLKGDLIVVARGDLTLGGRRDAEGHVAFTSMDHSSAGMDGAMAAVLTEQDPVAGLHDVARQIAASGIRHVQGDVIIDDRLFEPSRTSAGLLRTPILVNENLIDFLITPTRPRETARVDWRPRTACYEVSADVRTVAPGVPPQILVRQVGPGRIQITGEIPAGQPPSVRVLPVEDPPAFARTLLIEALRGAGIRVEAPLVGPNPSDRLPKESSSGVQVALLRSAPYSETVKLILKVSHNLGADLTPLLIAVKHGRRTFEEGLALERSFLMRAGVDVKGLSLSDGAGGNRADLVSPREAVRLLRYMAGHPEFKAFHDALPILGVDGTLAHSVPASSPARGKVHAKTGTILTGDLLNERVVLNVKGLAGYMTASSGRRLVFAFYVNHALLNDENEADQVGGDLGKLAEIVFQNQ